MGNRREPHFSPGSSMCGYNGIYSPGTYGILNLMPNSTPPLRIGGSFCNPQWVTCYFAVFEHLVSNVPCSNASQGSMKIYFRSKYI